MEIKLDFPYMMVLKEEYLVLKPDVTEEQFWELSNEDTNFELLDGVLYIHSPASTEHEEIFQYLLMALTYFLEKTQKGKIFGSRLVMRLSEKWNPEPDLQIIFSENYSKIQETRVEGPADLVIEILSKATRDTDLTKKLPKYLEVGVKEVWIIDPMSQEISVHRVNESRTWSKAEMDVNITSKILPDFIFKPKWLWDRGNKPVSTILEKVFSQSKQNKSKTKSKK